MTRNARGGSKRYRGKRGEVLGVQTEEADSDRGCAGPQVKAHQRTFGGSNFQPKSHGNGETSVEIDEGLGLFEQGSEGVFFERNQILNKCAANPRWNHLAARAVEYGRNQAIQLQISVRIRFFSTRQILPSFGGLQYQAGKNGESWALEEIPHPRGQRLPAQETHQFHQNRKQFPVQNPPNHSQELLSCELAHEADPH